jgi:dTDP-glucose 4,6-dehydratase
MSDFKKHILITGGAGFIGSHVVRLFVKNYPKYKIFNLDNLTYAGNLANLTDIENEKNYTFLKADICDENLASILAPFEITDIIHLAAESHVDRSISDPLSFVKTNVLGTANLLDFARKSWGKNIQNHLFYNVSTDEVYGSLGEGLFTETTAYDPRSPYSASKAGSDHLVRAYNHTFGLPIIISNCSNNYGSHQFPEKLIPLLINNCKQNLPLPIYGKGENIRDWLWVEDHACAINVIFHKGKVSETYNIGGINEWKNIDLVNVLCDLIDQKLNRKIGASRKLITFVTDRQGHDARYAIDATKLENELGWKPSIQFEEGLSKTIDWYLENENWIQNVTSGAYSSYYESQYNQR